MTDRPSDRAIAQAFREWCETSGAWRAHKLADTWIDKRAREIDAAAPEGAVADCAAVASFVERVAQILSGAPFPSGRSYAKARQVADLALTTFVSPSLGGEDGVKDREDAERYRWIRSDRVRIDAMFGELSNGDGFELKSGDDLDAAINAARAAGGAEG